MHLNHLSLVNFRTFSRLDIELPKGTLILSGRNAQGKTSFLEAIFYLATFTSFHTQNDRQLINFLALNETPPFTKINANIQKNKTTHEMDVRVILDTSRNGVGRTRKEIMIDGVKRTQQKAISTFNAVIFIPQMTRILEEGPDERRRFLNMSISQVMPGYAQALGDYMRTLEQRNALLKLLAERSGDPAQLDYWDAQLALHGSVLVAGRRQMVAELAAIAAGIYLKLTRNSETMRLEYRPAFNPDIPSDQQNGLFRIAEATDSSKTSFELQGEFEAALKQNRKEDIQRGVTSIGPHRDDLRMFSNEIDLSEFGSRGQIRTALLALKMAEVEWMKQKTGQYPVLLLDEVLAELDLQRRADLLDYLSTFEQAILTTTDLHLFSPSFTNTCTVWNIDSGKILPSPPGS